MGVCVRKGVSVLICVSAREKERERIVERERKKEIEMCLNDNKRIS